MNKNVRTIKTMKRNKRFAKISTIFAVVMLVMATATTGVFAAPSGVNTKQFDSIVNIVFWIIEGAIAIYGGVGLFHIVKGQNDEDARTRNGGIVGLGIAALGIGAVAGVKSIFF